MEDAIAVAGCVILDDYGRILLLHRNFGADGLWYLPGGKLQEDETPEAAALREIHEELGVQVHLTKALAHDEFEHNDTGYVFYWFLAEVVQGEPHIAEPELFDDLEYVEIEDLASLGLSAATEILHHKIVSGDIDLSA